MFANNKGEIKVKSLHKALMVLDCFAEKQPLSITEISEELGLYKSNVYDILSTLCAMGYLDRSTESSKFYLGKKIVVLGRMASDRYSFKNIAFTTSISAPTASISPCATTSIKRICRRSQSSSALTGCLRTRSITRLRTLQRPTLSSMS